MFIDGLVRKLRESDILKTRVIPPRFYAAICRELDNVGWHRVAEISDDMCSFQLQLQSESESEYAAHRLHFRITDPATFPESAPIVTSDRLPSWSEWRIEWPQAPAARHQRIAGVLSAYAAQCERFATFWRCVADFHENALVIEPRRLRLGCGTLRVLLDRERRTTMRITLTADARRCKAQKSECEFHGIRDDVEALTERWERNLAKQGWDPHVLPRRNVELILGVSLPRRDESGGNADVAEIRSEMECSFCLEFKDEEHAMVPFGRSAPVAWSAFTQRACCSGSVRQTRHSERMARSRESARSARSTCVWT